MINVKAFNGLTTAQVEKELTAMYNEPGGLEKIAALALQPLQEDVLYESRARQIFAQYDLAPGEEAMFDGDVRVPSYSLSVDGLAYQIQAKSSRVRIDTAPISAKALIKWNESNFRKFDMLDWTQARAKSSLLEQEDAKAIAVLDAAAEGFHSVTTSTTSLFVDKIAQAAADVSNALRTPAVRIIMAADRAADLAVPKSSDGATTGQIFAPALQDEILRKGVIGNVLGLEIITIPLKQDGSRIIEKNSVYVVGPKELVGVMAVRSEITPKAQVSVKDEGDIICFWEDIGWLVRYAKGVKKITIA